ncbi:MAG: cation:proton antiporter [Chloroflexi bacterium]|nr:cation:proton antiporter [Chloroflexota bacterium]
MGEERELVVDLVIIILAAAGGGLTASALRLPTVLGYLVAGLIVGNYIPGLEIDVSRLQDIAELGVALLLFALGVKFSVRKLADISRIAVLGGGLQILMTIGLGLLVGLAFGLDVRASLVLGYAVAISSTMVVLKLLEDRGDMDAVHARVALGILLVQDLAVVLMVILIGATAGEAGLSLAREVGFAFGKALLLLAATYLLATWVVPWFLVRVARTGSRELFLLAVLSIALGLAGGSFALGLSIAFGAFLAGLAVSESDYSYQTLAEVMPLRDMFATIFFVAMGMLIDPKVLIDEPGMVAAIMAVVVVGKLLLIWALVVAFGYRSRTALYVGLALAQMGEFSFVLSQTALDEGVVSADVHSAILMSALLSIFLTPILGLVPRIIPRLSRFAILDRLLGEPEPTVEGLSGELRRHAVVCGYGPVGRELVQALKNRDFPFIVVELDPYRTDELKKANVPWIYGDATNDAVLDACRVRDARIIAVTLSEPAAAEAIVRRAKEMNPRVDVIVRGEGSQERIALMKAGAEEVVHPELEAGLEFVRHTLHRFGVDSNQIRALLSRRRQDIYGP